MKAISRILNIPESTQHLESRVNLHHSIAHPKDMMLVALIMELKWLNLHTEAKKVNQLEEEELIQVPTEE